MRHARLVCVALCSAMLMLACAGSAFADPAGWKITQLTSGASAQLDAYVSGDRVVWHDTSPGGGICTWKSGEASQTLSAGDDGILGAPAVSGDRVVWLGVKSGVGHTIHMWTAGSGIATVAPEFRFTDSVRDAPLVSGDRVAWVDQPDGVSVAHVYTWKVGDSAPATASTNAYSIYDPIGISGNRLVWDCSTDGHAVDIYTRDMSAGDQVRITTHSGVYEAAYSPKVSGDRLVWVDDVGGMTVRTWNSDGTSMAVGPIANDGYLDPEISGDRVAWRVPDAGGVGQVATWKLGDSSVATLTSGGTNYAFHRFQQVSGDRVVWEENDGVFDRIMTWTPVSGVTTLSGNYEASDPQVSGDQVVWLGNVSGINQVFTASPAEQPLPPVATTLGKPTVSPSKPKKGKTATFATTLTPGAAGVAGASVTLALDHQETKSVRQKVRGKWRTVKVTYWHRRITVKMKRVSAAARFVASVKLGYKGSWRATVTATAPSGYSAPATKMSSFTVK
jgi:hypothetical protein